MVIDRRIVVDAVALALVDLDGCAVPPVVVGEGVAPGDLVIRDLIAVAVQQNAKRPRVVVSARCIHGHLVVVLECVTDDRVVGGALADQHARDVSREHAVLHAVRRSPSWNPDPRPAVLHLHLRDDDSGAEERDAVVRALDHRKRAAAVGPDHHREASGTALLDLQRPGPRSASAEQQACAGGNREVAGAIQAAPRGRLAGAAVAIVPVDIVDVVVRPRAREWRRPGRRDRLRLGRYRRGWWWRFGSWSGRWRRCGRRRRCGRWLRRRSRCGVSGFQRRGAQVLRPCAPALSAGCEY